ncbi:hypothetical protein [Arthrobacter castelli]|uniref:hypothetical protein n=1 Tax=Arthrobacter castelli TaxID=271431 RepID=UPI000417051B|nr:hypothetical protein [Arthrobacter castelli]
MIDVLYILALLACPVGMGLMMWFMMRGNKNNPASSPSPATETELIRLRAEVEQLKTGERDTGNLPAAPPAVDVRHHE